MEVSVRSVRNWWSKHKSCDSLADKKRSGRPKVLGRVERIILSKSVGKRKQSVRKLAKRMSARGYQGSKSTIQRHLKCTLGLRPYHRPVIPKLSEKNIADRLSFCKKLKRWRLSDWKNVIFSDESWIELIHAPNSKNDVVWAFHKDNVPPAEVVKHSPKVMVWAGMSFHWATELYLVPQGQTVDQEYYQEEILKKNLFVALNRTRDTGPPSQRRLVKNMSDLVFQQDGARPHTALRTQQLLRDKIPKFWDKDMYQAWKQPWFESHRESVECSEAGPWQWA